MNFDARNGPRIGVLVPFTNVNLEPDMAMMRPAGCTLHFARLGDYDQDAIPGSAQMQGLGAAASKEPLRLISGVRPDVVLYGCTSATLTHGPAFDLGLAQRLKDHTGAIAITAAGALIAALSALGVVSVGFASPYLGEINDDAVAFLQEHGVKVVKRVDIGRALDNYGQGALAPDEVFDLAMRAASDGVEAIVLSCTDMRGAEVVDRVEQATGLPVVTSNQAMVFALCRALGLSRPDGAPGRLFACL